MRPQTARGKACAGAYNSAAASSVVRDILLQAMQQELMPELLWQVSPKASTHMIQDWCPPAGQADG